MAGDAERRYIIGSGWQTVAVSASGIVTAADVDSDGAANGEVLTANGAGAATWEAGGGGSLPGWWTVDSTPGSESVEMDGSGATLILGGNLFSVNADSVVSLSVGMGGQVQLQVPDDDLELDLDTSGLVFKHSTDDLLTIGPTGAVTISPSAFDDPALKIRSDGDLLDVLNVSEDWGLLLGGDGRIRTFADPSVDGRAVTFTGGPNGSAAFRFLATDSGLIDDLLQVIDDNNNQVAKIGSTGAVTISPSDASVAVTVDSAGGATAALEADALPITGVADPTNPQDAATKNYADTTFALVAAGVPDATGASAGDVLTADGGGGFAWVAP